MSDLLESEVPTDVIEPSVSAEGVFADELWSLTKDVTALLTDPGAPVELYEVAAALQELSCLIAPADGPGDAAARIEELARLQAGMPCRIQIAPNGPYLVTNAERLLDHLGRPLPVRPQMALCRCGESKNKPFCDGSHAKVGFVDGKDPGRVPDRLDTYPGQQITVFDNRGTCAHSGLCTDRLSNVFRAHDEPFVAPSGGRMDEIVRAVRNCPSGALGYAIGGEAAPAQDRPASIEVSKDGPYRVIGAIPLTGPQEDLEPQNKGASPEHYSLCRCGHSQNKPFCSGMHWYVNFRDPEPDPDRTPTLFEWVGGLPSLTRMTRIFYERYVPEDPLLAPLFGSMEPDHPERVAAWLAETFGGPKSYTGQYGGYERMVSQHQGKALTEEQRARWAQLIIRSAADAGLPTDPEFSAAFVAYIEWGSRIAVENSQPGARPPARMPVPKWWWVCDAAPGTRVSALEPGFDERPPVELPAPGQAISFDSHVKPLFRAMDRRSMAFVFDLWSYDDVVHHADAILARLRQGSMPCDGAWPEEKVEFFARWINEGTPA
ncbi:CDGSH iron-sulfur domain-containing protein [Actinomadura barringtoniae]|uniref:CDGSH iron-sulfur domain-containing protein n=1 Tax=Actinomadura barringtoniae TaxID=1427535 RepID=A0A939T4G9_9ACTN|nr:CDGSH iron-sulfur domain-containing protein [Actinomadura barringtoniae]MBO2445897.1 CDGSH iron-sulfur domain-containing protein [Actinomadura barringtoniae]